MGNIETDSGLGSEVNHDAGHIFAMLAVCLGSFAAAVAASIVGGTDTVPQAIQSATQPVALGLFGVSLLALGHMRHAFDEHDQDDVDSLVVTIALALVELVTFRFRAAGPYLYVAGGAAVLFSLFWTVGLVIT
ncbi:hypothetical protein [Haloarchaeobius sp. DFWS5]|uniref:hypothetical protein n=1 Tax=Haloarchaeobius sp. DFWS5 TaxID=3446114 RepID=UPI003EB723A3